MRARVVVAVAALWAHAASADPRLEASGFVGVHWFGVHTELGNSWAPDQAPRTSALLGGRLSWLALPTLPGGLQLAIEGELGFAPAFTGERESAGRMSYFAPVFVWRAHALLRLARWREIEPHLVLGGGGETVASSSPFMATDTDPVAYWGAGVGARLSERWQLRLDVRHGVMAARGGGVTSTVEIQLGVGMTFGAAPPRVVHVEPPVVVPVRDPVPEPDPDGDGIVGAADQCPDQAEDVDGFQDEDGCPDPDNDQDGIADGADHCPLAAETRNGFEDEDGCPDELPAALTAALAARVRFEPGRARVTATGALALAPLLAALVERPALRLAITAHAGGGDRLAKRRADTEGGEALAKRRADAVKWYLVDQGIAEDRIVSSVGAADAIAVTFALVIVPVVAPVIVPVIAPVIAPVSGAAQQQ